MEADWTALRRPQRAKEGPMIKELKELLRLRSGMAAEEQSPLRHSAENIGRSQTRSADPPSQSPGTRNYKKVSHENTDSDCKVHVSSHEGGANTSVTIIFGQPENQPRVEAKSTAKPPSPTGGHPVKVPSETQPRACERCSCGAADIDKRTGEEFHHPQTTGLPRMSPLSTAASPGEGGAAQQPAKPQSVYTSASVGGDNHEAPNTHAEPSVSGSENRKMKATSLQENGDQDESHLTTSSVSQPPPDEAPPSDGGQQRLPSVCHAFTKSSCRRAICWDLHVCATWLTGRCKNMRPCRHPHSLSTAHNLGVLHAAGWQGNQCDQVRRWLIFEARCQQAEADGLPPLCVDHARGVCPKKPCDALHICPRFLSGACQRQNCPLGHELLDAHNRRVVKDAGHEDVAHKKLQKQIAKYLP